MDRRDSPRVRSEESGGFRLVNRDGLGAAGRVNCLPHRFKIESEGERVTPVKSNRGRPIVHTEPWAKITVVLLDRHVAYLDRLAIDIRLKHGKAISRAEIIRGLIEAAFQSGIDLSQAESIDTLVDLLVVLLDAGFIDLDIPCCFV